MGWKWLWRQSNHITLVFVPKPHGCLRVTSDGALRVLNTAASVEADAVRHVEMARRYHLSWRQTRAMRRLAPRQALLDVMGSNQHPLETDAGTNTMYRAEPLVVDPPGHRARAAAVAHLQDVIKAQICLAEANGRLQLNPVVDVIIAFDAPWLILVAPPQPVGDTKVEVQCHAVRCARRLRRHAGPGGAAQALGLLVGDGRWGHHRHVAGTHSVWHRLTHRLRADGGSCVKCIPFRHCEESFGGARRQTALMPPPT